MPRVPGLLVLVLSLLLVPLPARAGDLTLRDLIELHRAGLGDELLVAVIQADGGPFRLSYAEIMDLKTEGLSERVIAALVRTGSRTPPLLTQVAPAEELVEVAPAVATAVGEPEVIEVATPVVVVETVVPYLVPYAVSSPGRHGRDDNGHRDDDRHGRGDRHDSRQPSPATWVTRAEDGRNIAPSGRPVRSDAPRATWVTPNEISRHDSDSRGASPEKPDRNDDRDDRRGSRRDDDRKPRP
jgi:hypothetical protein